MIRLTAKLAPTPLAFLLLASSAMAQQSVIEHCRNTSSDADRIACLEAALMGKDAATTVAADPAPAPEPTPVPAAVPAAVTKTAPEGIGASQVIARTQTKEEKSQQLEKATGLQVTRYDTVPYEKLQVTLENGQVWRQINGDTQKIRVDLRRNQTVDITESSLSGFKMQLNEMRRSVRVERVR